MILLAWVENAGFKKHAGFILSCMRSACQHDSHGCTSTTVPGSIFITVSIMSTTASQFIKVALITMAADELVELPVTKLHSCGNIFREKIRSTCFCHNLYRLRKKLHKSIWLIIFQLLFSYYLVVTVGSLSLILSEKICCVCSMTGIYTTFHCRKFAKFQTDTNYLALP